MNLPNAHSKVILHYLSGPAPVRQTPSIRRPRSRRIGLALAAAAALAAGRVFAWPFVSNDWLLANEVAMPRLVPIQADDDRRLEFCTGLSILHRDGAGQGIDQDLPRPDLDPYAPNWPGVGFAEPCAAVGDIDGDGDQDVIQSCVLAYTGHAEPYFRLTACLNNGHGQFTRAWQWKVADPTHWAAYGPPVLLADLDDDGDLDLIEGYDSVRVRWNPGNGNFGGGSTALDTSLWRYLDFQAADFNRDGLMDLAAIGLVETQDPDYPDANNHTGRLLLFTSTSKGSFAKSIVTTLPLDDDYTQLELMDVNRDGRLDLVAGRAADSSSIAWHRNNGAGFDAAVTLMTSPNFSGILFAVGDLDEDGWPDLAFSKHERQVGWMRSTGPGSFGVPVVLADQTPNSTKPPQPIGLADHDGDGDTDLLYHGGLSFLENTAIHRAASASASAWAGTSPGGAVDLAVGDVNGDGRDDLIASDPARERLLWYPGGSTTLGAHVPVSVAGEMPTSVAAGDLDGDGDVDLAWTNGSQVKRTLNASGTGFGWYPAVAAAQPGASDVAIVDGDIDGDLDLLAASSSTGLVRWLNNNGDATAWSQENVVTSQSGVRRVAAGQTRPGGRPEVNLVASPVSGTALWRELQHSAALGWSQANFLSFATGNATGLVLADIQAGPGLDTAYAIGAADGGVVTAPSVYMFQPGGEVRDIASTDWNGDGFNDLLCAHTGGVTIHLHDRVLGGKWTPVTALNGVACAAVVAIDLNHDGRMDAVAAESATGKLHLLHNTSSELSLTHARAKADGSAVRITPGESATALTVTATSHGTKIPPTGQSLDALSVPESIQFRFRRAAPFGSGFIPGGLMTSSEVSAVVETVSFAGISAAPTPLSSGRFELNLNFFAQGVLTVGPGAARAYALGVTLRPTAANAPITRFYVEHLAGGVADSTSWRAFSADSFAGPRPLRAATDVAMPAALIEVRIPGPLEQWRMARFNTYESEGHAANEADPDGDGVPNLVEYVMNRNPQVLNEIGGGTPVVNLTSQGPNSPMLADLRLFNTLDPRVKQTLEQTSDLKTWTPLATRTGTNGWTGAQPATTIILGGRSRFVFTCPGTPATAPAYFLRLVVEELP